MVVQRLDLSRGLVGLHRVQHKTEKQGGKLCVRSFRLLSEHTGGIQALTSTRDDIWIYGCTYIHEFDQRVSASVETGRTQRFTREQVIVVLSEQKKSTGDEHARGNLPTSRPAYCTHRGRVLSRATPISTNDYPCTMYVPRSRASCWANVFVLDKLFIHLEFSHVLGRRDTCIQPASLSFSPQRQRDIRSHRETITTSLRSAPFSFTSRYSPPPAPRASHPCAQRVRASKPPSGKRRKKQRSMQPAFDVPKYRTVHSMVLIFKGRERRAIVLVIRGEGVQQEEARGGSSGRGKHQDLGRKVFKQNAGNSYRE